jgi:hypothetical protein
VISQPWIASSLDALLYGATERIAVHLTDGKSGASLEKLIIDGRPCFLKMVSAEDDWIMRVTGNTQWEFQLWQAGLYQRVPTIIDHAMIGMALGTPAVCHEWRCSCMIAPPTSYRLGTNRSPRRSTRFSSGISR